MLLHEIVAINSDHKKSILIESLLPYKKSLKVYYNYEFNDPILMVTEVFNACQYGKIVEGYELDEAIFAYLDVNHIETDENEEGFNEDLFLQYETICFNSISLNKL
jgi:hypothetical protein